MAKNKNKSAYYTLNCSNSYAYEFLKRLGFKYIILSSELNPEQIDKLIDSYSSRTNKRINPYVFMKGNKVLMYIKTNPFDKYINDLNSYYLSDGINKYIINKKHGITELITKKTSEFKLDNQMVRYFIINS